MNASHVICIPASELTSLAENAINVTSFSWSGDVRYGGSSRPPDVEFDFTGDVEYTIDLEEEGLVRGEDFDELLDNFNNLKKQYEDLDGQYQALLLVANEMLAKSAVSTKTSFWSTLKFWK